MPRPLQGYLPLFTIIITLAISIFRLVVPVVDNVSKAFKALEDSDPQVIQGQQAPRPEARVAPL